MKMAGLMKTAACGIMVASLTLVGGNAEARTLEEILKEKGVITAEDYAEVVKSSPFKYEPGKGLTVTSADGNSSMKIGGWAQLIYRYDDYDAKSKDDKSDFDIRRFKLAIQGNAFSKNFGYKFQGDVSSGFVTEDVFVNYKFATPFIGQVGQFKPPQARQELTSSTRQLFVERSLANDTFNLGRDQGLQAAGSFADKLVEYRLGIFNGNGPNKGNPDNRHMYAGRLDLNPLGAYAMDEAGWPSDKPLLNLGGSFAWNKVGGNDVGSGFDKDNDVMEKALALETFSSTNFEAKYGSELTWLLWTANLNASWLGASFAAEYYNLNADPDLGKDWDADGYYVQAGYQILPNTLDVGVRYSEIKSDDADASAKFDKSETQVCFNYYFKKHNLKLQGDYTWVNDDMAKDKDDQVARLQLQFAF
jgi:phosphate-selective porin OprO and OprP